MSDLNVQNIQGILSGWNSIEADIRTGLHEDFGKSKDIQDILDSIHDLQETANTVSPLRILLKDHIENINNPHEITLSLVDLQLVDIMYDLYTARFGIDMSITEFSYALINIKRFATIADINNQTNLDSVVNVNILNYLIDNHDKDTNAHNNLFRYKLPGEPIIQPPSDIIEANISVNSTLIVDRACPMAYHDINGRVVTIGNNLLPVDYSFGKPACPIFGPHRNILLNSKLLSDVSFKGSIRSSESSLLIVTPISDTNFLLLQESPTLDEHGFTDTLPQEITGIQTYTIYYYPIERTTVLINIRSVSEIICSAIFDCDDETYQSTGIIDNVIIHVNNLPSGWYRLSITFDATNLNVTSFDVLTKNIIDAVDPFNSIYQGETCNAGGFWQHQCTDTPLPVPPIFTDTTPVSILGTKVTRSFNGIYNPIRGTFLVKYLSPMSEVFGTKSAIFRLGQNIPNIRTAVSIETNPVNAKRNRIISYNVENEVLSLIDSDEYNVDDPQFVKRVVFTYGLGMQGYGFTDQAPQVFQLASTDVIDMMVTFFENIYDGSIHMTGTKILQLPQSVISEDATDEDYITNTESNIPAFRINMDVNLFELGYNSISGNYLDGYILNFRYYSVFASELNIEFLLDQYIPS